MEGADHVGGGLPVGVGVRREGRGGGEEEYEEDDEHIIDETYDTYESEPQEELIDITKQSEITDDEGIILDDVIDSIINDVDDIKKEAKENSEDKDEE